MKKHVRVMVVMMVLVMALSACQPTPESEPVVNKGDRVLEEKISATAPTQNPTEGEGKQRRRLLLYSNTPSRRSGRRYTMLATSWC